MKRFLFLIILSFLVSGCPQGERGGPGAKGEPGEKGLASTVAGVIGPTGSAGQPGTDGFNPEDCQITRDDEGLLYIDCPPFDNNR